VSPDAFRNERQRLQDEIDEIEKSLAAAEERLTLDTDSAANGPGAGR